MTSAEQREKQYQALRLYHSNLVSLTDLKASFRIISMAGHKKYSGKDDQKDVLKAKSRIETLERLTETRDAARQRTLLRLKKPPRLTNTRADEISAFVTGYKTGIPANWERYGILRAKGKRKNPPRHGSSKGKIAPVRYAGWKRFNKDFDKMARQLDKLLSIKGKASGINQQLQEAKRSIKVRPSIK